MSGARLASVGAVALGLVLVAGWFLMGADAEGVARGEADLLRAAPAAARDVRLPEATERAEASATGAQPAQIERSVAPLAEEAVENARQRGQWVRLRKLADDSLRSGPDSQELVSLALDLLALAPVEAPRGGPLHDAPALTLMESEDQGVVRSDGLEWISVDLLARPGEFSGIATDAAERLHMSFGFELEERLLTEVSLRVQLEYQRSPGFAADLARRSGTTVGAHVVLVPRDFTWRPIVLTTSQDARGYIEWHLASQPPRSLAGPLTEALGGDLGRLLASRVPEVAPDDEPPTKLR